MAKNFTQEIFERFKMPWKYSAFRSYFLFIVIFYGGCGVFLSIYDCYINTWTDSYKIAQNMATYFMAIIAASLVDLNLSSAIKNMASLIINSIALLGFTFVLFLTTYLIKSHYAFLPASIGTVISLIIWILANADNEKLSDESYYNKMRGKEEGHGTTW